jgi:hypothetical protein
MKIKIGFLAATLLILFIFHFELSEQGPVKLLLKRLRLLSHRQDRHPIGIHKTTGNHHNKNNNKNDIDNDDDEADKEGTTFFDGNNVLEILRHYVRVVKIIRGANMMLDVRDMYVKVGDYFRTYLT